MKKLFLIATILFLSLGFVAASSISTSEFTNNAYPNQPAYRVTYDITEPGWYLLPYQSSLGSLASDTDFDTFYYADDYKYGFSPFTKEYVLCTREPNTNPLSCDVEGLYGQSISYLTSLSEEEFARNYLVYTALSADWHYYSKPVSVSYEYHPFILTGFDGDDTGLFGAKLKSGWNIITYPPHLAYGDTSFGDCTIEQLYGWESIGQQWTRFTDSLNREGFFEDITDGESGWSGVGLAIKVTSDCTFVKEKSASGGGPPGIPN